jgi:2-methylisocitrate lyase-like PEP mutase family enzyme
VGLAIETGVAGLSSKIGTRRRPGCFYIAVASERVHAAKLAIEQSGEDVILVARTEGLLLDPGAVTAAIDELVAFAEAGADCLYAPGVQRQADIAALVRAVAPKALNVLSASTGLSVAALAELGVPASSVGGALARVAWGAVLAAAEQLQQQGSFESLADALPGKRLNDIFAGFPI